MVVNPKDLAKKEKQKKYREAAKARKAANKKTEALPSSSTSKLTPRDEFDSDIETSSDVESPVIKKQKLSDPDELDNSSDTVTITTYIHVLRPSVPTAVKGHKKADPGEDYVQRGPFKFLSNTPYHGFLDAIAEALPCPSADNIIASKITWKPQKPLKASPLPLGGEVGYGIMIEQVEIKKPDARIIILIMPAPSKPLDEKLVSIHFT